MVDIIMASSFIFSTSEVIELSIPLKDLSHHPYNFSLPS
jgi:hypothetical protein